LQEANGNATCGMLQNSPLIKMVQTRDLPIYWSTPILSANIWSFEYRPMYKFSPIFWCTCRQHSLYQIHLDNIKTSKFYWNLLLVGCCKSDL